MRASRVAAAAALCVLAAGCGSVRPPSHAPVAVRTGRVATAARNRAAAWAEATRLLSLARVPPGAVRLARPPRSLPGPALGRPEVASLVSAAPAGPDASVIRVDAVIVWLDPRPVPSGPGAHPVRVTVTGDCPPGDQGVTGVANPGAGLTRHLLPPGQPTAGLRCRYDGLNGHPWHLVAAQRLTATAARPAARSMARLPLSHPDGGVMSCPMDDDSAGVLALAYPGRPDVDLWIKLNGCGGVSNGYITASGT